MQALMKFGAALLLLAIVLVGLSYQALRAQETNHPRSAEGRAQASESRSVDARVTIIRISGPVDLILTQGTTPSMTVRAEQRLLSKIRTVQEGNTLQIDIRSTLINARLPLQVELTLPALQQLQMSGSGDASISGFSGDEMQLTLNGSGDATFAGQYRHIKAQLNGSGDLHLQGGNSDSIELALQGSGDVSASGSSKALSAQLHGSGDLNARQLIADSVSLSLLGSGDAAVFARTAVSAALRGSGDATIFGQPAQRSVSASGSGEVIWE